MRRDEYVDDGPLELVAVSRPHYERPFLRVHTQAGVTVAELHGEIDIQAVQALRPRLDTLTGDGVGALAVDLRPIRFLDCSGLALLVRAHRRVTERGGSWALVCDHPLTLRILRITALTNVLGPAPTLEQALDSVRPPNGTATAGG
ncbi:STAS domain-containing protein [Streptomyces sp. BPTC-684]|uniref:STAS domain-containing protein n=1 Tax=Streptomyces sp. BPTC-684 TaxID=3043734 RepID=UPI0024B1807A|nr:STAS domain-containing protein [Streptomyces sp. BPTC-684]WHM40135.1 STAS domain-containing protein [Streptomyces sp. BPTC-684]